MKSPRLPWGSFAQVFLVLLLACFFPLGSAAQASPELGAAGFEACSGPGPASIDGVDLEGAARSLSLKGDKLIVLHYFRSGQSDPKTALAALEKLRTDYSGRLIVAAVSSAPYRTLAAALTGEEPRFPVISNPRGASFLGLPDKPSYLVIGPGGELLAKRVGTFDWSSPEGRSLAEALLARSFPAPASAQPASSPAPAPGAPAQPSSAAPYLSPLEAGVVEEVNLARTDPRGYASFLREYRSFIHGGIYERPGKIGVSLQEGTRAVDEAIAFLEKQKPLPPLEPSKGLSAAARTQAVDQKGGATGHTGSDGSSPFQRMNRYGSWSGTAGENIAYGAEDARGIVIQLVVDDGVASRGHRANIFGAAYARIGVGAGPHARYGAVCVQDFAAAYSEK